MATTNKTSALRLKSNAPASGECVVFADTQEMLRYLEEHLYVHNPTGADDGKLTFGNADPQGVESRENVLHVLRDASERSRDGIIPAGYRYVNGDAPPGIAKGRLSANVVTIGP